MTTTTKAPRNPSKYSTAILAALAQITSDELEKQAALGRELDRDPFTILDPFAGTGLIHQLAEIDGVITRGVEIQPEWAAMHPDTYEGDATDLVAYGDDLFDAVMTSPVYPNRMTDHHEAKDACKRCGGTGCRVVDCLGAHPDDGQDHGPCKLCNGHGLSKRNTYTHALAEAGAKPAEGSSVTLGWSARGDGGIAYRQFSARALAEMRRVVMPNGLIVINMSNHPETVDGVTIEHHVVEWYLNHCFATLGLTLDHVVRVPTPRFGQGANGNVRIDGEVVMVLRNSKQPGTLL